MINPLAGFWGMQCSPASKDGKISTKNWSLYARKRINLDYYNTLIEILSSQRCKLIDIYILSGHRCVFVVWLVHLLIVFANSSNMSKGT